MACKPRIEYEGAFYRFITRGNQRQKIFKDLAAHQEYLLYLSICKSRSQFSFPAFVLRGNHVNLPIETPATPLSKRLQSLNQRYPPEWREQ